MILEYSSVSERLFEATGTASNRSLSLFLGYSQNAASSWMLKNSVPAEACFIAGQKTGFDTDWIATGKLPKKRDYTEPDLSFDDVNRAFRKTMTMAIRAQTFGTGKRITEEGIDAASAYLFSILMGKGDINSQFPDLEKPLPKAKNHD